MSIHVMEVHPHCHNDVVGRIAFGLLARCLQEPINLRASVTNLSEIHLRENQTYQLHRKCPPKCPCSDSSATPSKRKTFLQLVIAGPV